MSDAALRLLHGPNRRTLLVLFIAAGVMVTSNPLTLSLQRAKIHPITQYAPSAEPPPQTSARH